MRKTLFPLALAALMAGCGTPSRDGAPQTHTPAHDQLATPGKWTMRFDYHHTGNHAEEHFAFDQAVNDGPWAGNPAKNIDTLRLGKYFFEVLDTNGEVLYSQGFSSIYGEWETTPEAREEWGSFHESVRFPYPGGPVRLRFHKRGEGNAFAPVWEYSLEPNDFRVNPRYAPPRNPVEAIVAGGEPSRCVDIVVLGEGYASGEQAKFSADARAFAQAIENCNAFESLKGKININTIFTPSPSSGCNHPHQGHFKRSALGVSYGAFDSERYALTYDNRRVRDVASAVPYEFTAILLNDTIYGGGGIYNLYITAAAGNEFRDYLFVHEFGHHFADLADEYYTSATSYEMGSALIEPWELNVTIATDRSKIKWGDLIAPSTPVPTPWDKATFDAHSISIQERRVALRANKAPEWQMNSLFREQQQAEEAMFRNMEHHGKVGLFEGAQYHALGIYRSSLNCTMYTRTTEFCPACVRAFALVGARYLP